MNNKRVVKVHNVNFMATRCDNASSYYNIKILF